ncbi:MAG: hypothetical protein QOI21_6101 [Actinomycetota bacterium]|jgi:hypothetical protein|nr:hypothetical protein [Actinomycetota bacterium]
MFDAKKVTWREWLGLGAGLLAAVSAFLPWSTLSASAPDVQEGLRSLPPQDVERSAWNSDFLSWFPPILLLLIGVAVVLFGQVGKVHKSGLPQLWLVAVIIVLLLMAIGWYAIDLQFGSEERALFRAGGIVVGSGFGRYLGFASGVVSLVAAILDSRSTRRT